MFQKVNVSCEISENSNIKMFHVKQSDISNNKMFHVKHFERNHSRGKTSAFVLGRHRGSDNGVARRHGAEELKSSSGGLCGQCSEGCRIVKCRRRAVRTAFATAKRIFRNNKATAKKSFQQRTPEIS